MKNLHIVIDDEGCYYDYCGYQRVTVEETVDGWNSILEWMSDKTARSYVDTREEVPAYPEMAIGHWYE